VGGTSGVQFIASNVDTVFVVAGCGPTRKLNERGLNARRLERILWVVRDGGARPIVVLNKADLIEDAEAVAASLSRRLGGAKVCFASAQSGLGVEALERELAVGDTIALIGPSGVGKSTLINRLLGEERQHTGEARQGDSKGRHTTTRRELLRTRQGALLIDTPGMREIALYSEDGEAQGFDDIGSLAAGCRFADCTHAKEPGCAVRAAVERGEIDSDRLESFANLKSDASKQATRHGTQVRRTLRREQRKARVVKGT
jgi:ribosome biogenesis GTPase